MSVDNDYIKTLIANYEANILGNRYIFELADGETLSFCIEKRDIPHLLGIRKLNIRQVQNRSAIAIYEMLKKGSINIRHVAYLKESYKKVCNFDRMLSVIADGDVVKVVKKLGSIKSSYLIYLDNRPEEILHLGVVKSEDGKWHPETFLINRQRNVSAYIDDQIQVEVLKRYVVKSRQEKMPDDELFEYMV